MGYRKYGAYEQRDPQGVWGTGVWDTWAIEAWGYGYKGYGPHRLWSTWAMGPMGHGAYGQWGPKAIGTFLPITSLILDGFLQKFNWT